MTNSPSSATPPSAGPAGEEAAVARTGGARLPTLSGDFNAVAYSSADGNEHLALVMGDVQRPDVVLARVHSACMTGDVFSSLRCDCGPQLTESLARIASAKVGVLIYLDQEGRGIGLGNKIRAYRLQQDGLDTVEANLALGFPADVRDYAIAAKMLLDLGVTRVRLLTNNPRKVSGLRDHGIDVVGREPVLVGTNPNNEAYLHTKSTKLGHTIPGTR